MNDEDKEQIKQIISNNVDQVIDQFLAKKQAEVNKGGSDNQEIHCIDLKSEFETTRQEIYKKLGRSKHTDGVDKAIDTLIYNHINNYIYDLAVNNVYSADCYEKCVVMYMLGTLGFGLFHLCLFFLTAVMRFRTDAFFALHRDRFSDLS